MTVIKEDKLETVVDFIGTWIKEKLQEAGAATAVVGLSGGADSALVALICKSQGIPLVVVRMPCQSSQNSLDRAQELIDAFGMKSVTVVLDDAFYSIANQAVFLMSSWNWDDPATRPALGALRSCLRAPTLDFVAKLTKGLIVGTGNRDEDEKARYFQKRGDGAVDISPIAKLHKSEVYQLLKYLGCPQSIIEARPSADLWGPDSGQEDEKEMGLSYDEVEWGTQFLDKNSHVTFMTIFSELTPRQLDVLKKLYAMDVATAHKAEMPPVCDVRDWLQDAFEDVYQTRWERDKQLSCCQDS